MRSPTLFLAVYSDTPMDSTSLRIFLVQVFKQLDVNINTTLSIFFLNVRNFRANFDTFPALFASCKLVPGILLLSETWFTHDSPRELDGYIGHHVTRLDGRGRGK